MEAQTSSFRSFSVELFESGHRRWPEAVKAQSVAETREPAAFAPLVLCEPTPPRAQEPSLQPDDKLRLIFGDVALELGADAPAVRISEIVHAFGAPS